MPVRSSPFAPRASRVVRALLREPTRAWRLSELATLVELNPGNVHRALDALRRLGHVERDAERYLVPDPGSLLEAWADAAVQSRERLSWPLEGLPLRDAVADVVERLDGEAVVSGDLAAESLAPLLPAQAALVHCVDGEAWVRLQAASVAIGPPSPWHPAAERLVVDLSDEGVAHFGAPVDGLPLVSPQQLYVDLVHAGGRARGRRGGSPATARVLMPRLVLSVERPADRVLLAGLPHLQPVIEAMSDGVLLIGGLATTAWLASSPLELPLRATRDVDLGVDRVALGLTGRTRRIVPLLERHDFSRRVGDEPFRFRRTTDLGDFLVDLLLTKGASRARPPLIEPGLDSVAAPGLAMRSPAVPSDSTFGSARRDASTASTCRSSRSTRCW